MPKQIILDYPLECLIELGWRKEGDFEDLHKFYAFTLATIGKLLLSTKKTHVEGPVMVVVNQVKHERTLIPMILAEILLSLSHFAEQGHRRLLGSLGFLQAWLREHLPQISSLWYMEQFSNIPVQSHMKQFPKCVIAYTEEYMEIFNNITTDSILWRRDWCKRNHLHTNILDKITSFLLAFELSPLIYQYKCLNSLIASMKLRI